MDEKIFRGCARGGTAAHFSRAKETKDSALLAHAILPRLALDVQSLEVRQRRVRIDLLQPVRTS